MGLRLHLLVRDGPYGQRPRTACGIERTQRKWWAPCGIDPIKYYSTEDPLRVRCGNCTRTRALALATTRMEDGEGKDEG